MANEYEIARGTGKCATSGRELAQGEFYFTALFEQPDGFERRDFAVEAWSGPPDGCFCYWKTRVPTREKKPSIIAVDNALLMNLFCRLEEDSSEMRQKFRFVLALLLMRKRLLRLERTVREGDREYWQMRLTAEQSVHQVLNPHLSNEEIDRLSGQLAAILSGDSSAITAMEEQAGEGSADAEPIATAEPAADDVAEPPITESAAAPDLTPHDMTAHDLTARDTTTPDMTLPETTAESGDTQPDKENTRATE